MKGKKRMAARTMSLILSFALTCSMALQLPWNRTVAEAASTADASENLLKHCSFEEEGVDLDAVSRVGNWFTYGGSVKTQEQAHNGSWAVKLPSPGLSTMEQDIKLIKGATYEFSAWVKGNGTDGVVGFKYADGTGQQVLNVDSSDWKKYSLEFTCEKDVDVRCFVYYQNNGGPGGPIYVDDPSLILKGDMQRVSIQNGTISAEFQSTYVGTPSKDDFEITYSTSLNPEEILPLAIANTAVNETVFTMNFVPFEKEPVEQTITVFLKYKPSNQFFTIDYTLEASGEPTVTGEIAELTCENGSLTAKLSETPTISPTQDDFEFAYSTDQGKTYQPLTIQNFSYQKAEKSITATFQRFAVLAEEQNFTIRVTYAGKSKESSFTIALGEGVTYYVDATNGNDSNNGTSPETAFQTIDRLNSIYFNPDDQVLFKKGETFVGAFQPQGSGIEGHPIVISSYGEGETRPVLKPGEDWTIPYLMSAEVTIMNPKVNHIIKFYNQSYWEVQDLELWDPKYEQINEATTDVYRSGICVSGENAGQLEHFYFNNLVIHGFRGPSSNMGKSAGGIVMNVYRDPEKSADEQTPTSINDIRITNCELYNLGRSGVNFLNPWARRAETGDTKWGPQYMSAHAPRSAGFEWTPYKDFYLANNVIHDIDGDGCIVDNCLDAVVENNLVYRCSKTQTGMGASVGLFNWNSDNTIFQFNEVFEVLPAGDSQGIEIDALNDRTVVQFNYVHDNAGGLMMWCNTGDGIRSFDGIVRYNISQNDGVMHGFFDYRPYSFGSMVYNNTIYIKPDALDSNGNINLFGYAGSAKGKFYNNIFYYTGEQAKPANTFNDDAIDWQSNIFYNFSNLPVNDNPSAPNTNDNPMLVDPGKGTAGSKPGTMGSGLNGYALQEGSPAVNAGVPIQHDTSIWAGMANVRDFFGNSLSGLPDTGAYDSGTESQELISTVYSIDQDDKVIFVLDSGRLTAETVLSNLMFDGNATLSMYHGLQAISGDAAIQSGDTVKLSRETELVYRIQIVHDPDLLLVSSKVYPVDSTAQTISLPTDKRNTVQQLLLGLETKTDVSLKVFRGTTEMTGNMEPQVGDTVLVSKGDYQAIYLLAEPHDASSDSRDIPTSQCTATAGSQQAASGAEGPASNVLDGNSSTIWHSLWAGDSKENLFITISLNGDYKIDGLRCQPRGAGGSNGVITKYRIQYSTDGSTFTDVPGAVGNWNASGWQDVQFAPISAKAIRLYAEESISLEAGKIFASAAEIRLTGVQRTEGDNTSPAVPTSLSVHESSITESLAIVRWDAPEDKDLAGYRLIMNDGTNETSRYVSGSSTSTRLQNLLPNTTYSISVSAIDTSGNESEKSAPISLQTVNKTELLALYQENQARDRDLYTKDSWNAFITALYDASGVLEETNSIQSQVDKAKKSLEEAVDGLIQMPDKTSLEALYNANKDKRNDNYTDTSWAAFTQALEQAKTVLENGNATQEAVDAAKAGLQAAIDGLEKKPEEQPDKTGLEALYNANKDKRNDNYTDTSWAAFTQALEQAKTVLENGNATQEAIDAAKAELQAAIDGLEKKPSNLVWIDEESQVQIEAEPGVIPEDAELVVESIGEGSPFKEMVQNALAGLAEQAAVWDIRLLKEGAPVQPAQGMLLVTLPIPQSYKTELLKVYRINPDGTSQELPFTVSGSKVTFGTDCLGLYALVQMVQDSSSNSSLNSSSQNSSTPSSNGGSVPATGDTGAAVPLMALFGAALAVAVLRRKKRI